MPEPSRRERGFVGRRHKRKDGRTPEQVRALGRQIRAERLQKLGYPSYAAYLRSEHWQNVKRAYFASGRPRDCFVCGGGPVQIHHRSYARIGRERPRDLVALCRGCHEEVHRVHNERFGYVTLWNAAEVVRDAHQRLEREARRAGAAPVLVRHADGRTELRDPKSFRKAPTQRKRGRRRKSRPRPGGR